MNSLFLNFPKTSSSVSPETVLNSGNSSPQGRTSPFSSLSITFDSNNLVIKNRTVSLATISPNTTLQTAISTNPDLDIFLEEKLTEKGFKETWWTQLRGTKKELKEEELVRIIAPSAKKYIQFGEGVSGKNQEFNDKFICPVASKSFQEVQRIQTLCQKHFSKSDFKEIGTTINLIIQATKQDENVLINSTLKTKPI